jgi:tetratricopeptide (TPR) repeat protein
VAKGRRDEAIGLFEKALNINPDLAAAHSNLAGALEELGRRDEAISHLKEALRIDRLDARGHYNFGLAMHHNGCPGKAIEHYKEAIRLNPNNALAHYNLGNALTAMRQLNDAIINYKQAVRLDPSYAPAYNNLGHALETLGRLDEAIDNWRQGVRVDSKNARARLNFGIALTEIGQVEQSVLHLQEAIKIDPKLATAYGAYGRALVRLGRFAEARDAGRICLTLLPQDAPVRAQARRELDHCERMIALEARLPAILSGRDKPASTSDRLDFAMICHATKHFAATARHYAAAFADDPALSNHSPIGLRYSAACAMARAAAGQGTDDPKPDAAERARLRQQTLDWLRAELALMEKLTETGRTNELAEVQRFLWFWHFNPDLASVRDTKALAKLAATEREAWTNSGMTLKPSASGQAQRTPEDTMT